MQQLDGFFIEIIRVTFLDAIIIGMMAGLIVSAVYGIKLGRHKSTASISWVFGGVLALAIATAVGWVVIQLIGQVVVWTGEGIHGLEGLELGHWRNLVSAMFATYQMEAVVFSLVGALLGVSWGYGVGIEPRGEASAGGIALSTLAICVCIAGFTLIAIQYLGLFPMV